MSALYVENGIEYAVDDVSGALLDPGLVHEGRATEMKEQGIRPGTQEGAARDRRQDHWDQVDRCEQGRHRPAEYSLQTSWKGIPNNSR